MAFPGVGLVLLPFTEGAEGATLLTIQIWTVGLSTFFLGGSVLLIGAGIIGAIEKKK
jgi:hypothetical protein